MTRKPRPPVAHEWVCSCGWTYESPLGLVACSHRHIVRGGQQDHPLTPVAWSPQRSRWAAPTGGMVTLSPPVQLTLDGAA